MKYAYYPGCSLHSSAKAYDYSLRAVSDKLGIELLEVKNWFCCGSTPAHSVSLLLASALSLGNLALVNKMGLQEVVVPCESCYSRFKTAQLSVKKEPSLSKEIESIIKDNSYENIRVYHPLEILSQPVYLNKLAGLVTHPLGNLKVVCFYGCLLTRPPGVTDFDNAEYPESMDRIMRSLSITSLDWSYKTECCGGAFSLTRKDIVLKLSREILKNAKSVGADAIVVACPLCHMNLDARQQEIEKIYHESYGLPVFYFTQLMGIGLGLSSRQLLFSKHFINTGKILQKVS